MIRYFKSLVVLGSFLSIAVASIAAIAYFFDDSFRDHVEASIASISVAWHHGYEIYPNNQSMRSLLYGPLVFLLSSAFFSMFGAVGLKFFGVLAFILAIITTIRLAQKETHSLLLSVVLVSWYFSILLLYREVAFWNRPDPLIFLIVAVYTLVFSFSKYSKASFLISTVVSVGVMANLKFHAVLYLLPLFLYWFRLLGLSFWVNLPILIIGTLVVFSMPFLLPGVSLAGYIDVLHSATKHGLETGLIFNNIKKGLYLFIPVLLSFLYRPKENFKESVAFGMKNKLVSLGAVSSYIVVSILAGKKGAGGWHMLPFAPIFILVAANLFAKSRGMPFEKNRFLTVAASFLLLLYQFKGISRGLEIIENSYSSAGSVALELQQLAGRFKNQKIHMGFSGNATYHLTFQRWRLIGINSPLLMDPASLMDLKVSGVDINQKLLELFTERVISCWVLPKNDDPFSIGDPYINGENLISEEVRKYFIGVFNIADESENFLVWCRA